MAVTHLLEVPEELRLLRQWICWRREDRDGHETKVPYDAQTGRLAATNQPRTWTTFDEALAVRENYDGLGFVLTGTSLVGFDFDGVIAESGNVEDYILEILRRLGDPYTEITPSGRGLRAFIVAPLPPGGRKFGRKDPKYGAEVYSGSEGGRYLTVTGNRLQGEGVPKTNNITLPYFLLCQILDEKFKKLWTGDVSDYDGDDSRADLALMGMLARRLDRHRANMEGVFSESRLGQRKKWERADYRKRTLDKALGDNSGAKSSSSVLTPEHKPISLTDTGNADLVIQKLDNHGLYCREQKRWYLADQTERWSPDRTNRITKIVQDTMQHRWDALAKHPDPKDPRLRHALKSLDYRAISNCVNVIEFQQTIAVLPESLDSDGMKLGVQNGILDLLSGTLLSPRLDLLVTKCANVRFDPAAQCDRFSEYLERVQPEKENRNFLARLAGACLSGLQPEQSFIFFHGCGANGKSVFVRVLSDLLGSDYCFKARKQLLFLSGRRSEYGANDVVDLEGKRLITSTEQHGRIWNTEFIKDFTGGELQHGRQLYRTALNFKPTGKIIVSANWEPVLTEFDEAMKRRFICLPWNVVIPTVERVSPLDLFVSSLLRDDGAAGILNWSLAGLHDLILRNWKLDPPEAAVGATEAYITNEDRVGRFFQDWFEDGPIESPYTTRQLREYFVAWLDEPEKSVMSAKAFTRECQRIFGKRCHIRRSNWHAIEGLRLSERGRADYAQHRDDLFSSKSTISQ